MARRSLKLKLSQSSIQTVKSALRSSGYQSQKNKEFNNPLGLAYGVYSPADYRVGWMNET